MNELYQLDTNQVLKKLNTNAAEGLTDAEAARRLEEHGPNVTVEKGARSPLAILFEQLKATMVLILIAAAVVSAFLGSVKDAVAIGAIVILFVIVGFVQEYRAEQAIAALKKMAVPFVKALRGGQIVEVPSGDLVPGDIILLETGNIVPADGRVLEAVNLRLMEAALTGESEAVDKTSEALQGNDLPPGDQRNMLFMGTVVTFGRGRAVVAATGMHTELGKIAELIGEAGDEQTPLQRRLDQLGRVLAIIGVLTAGLIVLLGVLRGENLNTLILTGVSVAVAVVPEGLPAVVTITLALGAQRMLKRQALIRKLPAVETLGSVNVICSDKTGTLTENRMTVIVVDVGGRRAELTEQLRDGSPSLLSFSTEAERDDGTAATQSIALLLASGALANDAQLIGNREVGNYRALGDPTEAALVVAAAKFGMWKDQLDQLLPRISELPFDSERKRMTTLHAASAAAASYPQIVEPALAGAPYVSITKGSVEGMLSITTRAWMNDHVVPLTSELRARIQNSADELSRRGIRVLGAAFRPHPGLPPNSSLDALERDLIFVGLFGLIDPPRPEVKTAVATCKQAGIRPVMITGDHPLTAIQIARELGITENAEALTGKELEQMTPAELEKRVPTVSVFARVSPEHKLKIVQALQNRGNVVAMTGDGVNDAPALRRADVGVAMGITGTDVAKGTADIVLLNDNFATIVSAIEEGRVIYDNIRKFIKFSIAGNLGKVLVMLLAPFIGDLIPLLPLQLLWLNVLTDGLLGLGLGVEPPEPHIMSRPPEARSAPVLGRQAIIEILLVGSLIGAIAIGVGLVYEDAGYANWQTMVFTTLAFAQIFQAFASRGLRDSVFSMRFFANPTLLAMMALVFGLQLLVIYVPFLQGVFQTLPLSPYDLAICIALGSLVLVLIEIEKFVLRRRDRAVAVAR